ncbi:TPA: hypothetical protein DEP21_00120, partial [Patescibacteria group bacterium]|nr:hypothetical protein [Candidatus Gracilibacteria bacterium]
VTNGYGRLFIIVLIHVFSNSLRVSIIEFGTGIFFFSNSAYVSFFCLENLTHNELFNPQSIFLKIYV